MSLGVGNLVSAVIDPGKIVREVVDAVLPEQLDVVADLAGAAASYYSGRPLQAVGHLAQAMKDLPQAFDQPGGAVRAGGSWRGPPGGSWRDAGSPAFQPPPPPSRGSDAGDFSLDKLLSLLQSILDALGGKKAAAASGSSPASKGSKPGAAEDDSPSGSTSTSTSTTKKSSSSSSSTSKEDTALEKLNKLSDAEFMAKIRKGDLPKEITDDPKAMLAIQQRVNHISEMTQMMSAMMKALHDMQMAILQNVRV
jgi:hypothetical protein